MRNSSLKKRGANALLATVFLGCVPVAVAQPGAPLTSLEAKIVAAATAATRQQNGRNPLSGQSSTQWSDSAGRKHAGIWITDVAGKDGSNIRSAVQTYHDWVRNTSKTKPTKAAVEGTMRVAISKSYNTPDTAAIVTQIEQQIDTARALSRSVSFQSDDDLLALLVVQGQCFEFANRIAVMSGGSARSYSYSTTVDWNKIRPGMAIYRTNSSHAAIIQSIQWDNKTGLPVYVTVFEANFGSGFNKPNGMIPWRRVAAASRVLDWKNTSKYSNLNYYRVVRFE